MAELCPGIIFPTPYPPGYGGTPLVPRVRRPLHGVSGSMHEGAQDRNAGWHLQLSRGVTGRLRTSLALGHAVAPEEHPCPHRPARGRPSGPTPGPRAAPGAGAPRGRRPGTPPARRTASSAGRRSVVSWCPPSSRGTDPPWGARPPPRAASPPSPRSAGRSCAAPPAWRAARRRAAGAGGAPRRHMRVECTEWPEAAGPTAPGGRTGARVRVRGVRRETDGLRTDTPIGFRPTSLMN